MMLVDNWHVILRRAWSVRLMLIAAILSGVEAAWPILGGVLPIPQSLFSAVTGLTVAAAFFARLVAQKGITNANPADQVK